MFFLFTHETTVCITYCKMLVERALNPHRVGLLMREQDKSPIELANRLRRSVTFARQVMNGYLPNKSSDAEFVVNTLAAFLGVKPKEILISERRKTA